MYQRSVVFLSFLFIALGLAILARTLAAGGGPLAMGAFLGIAFVGVGILRLWSTGFFRGRLWGRGGSDG